MFFKKLFGKTHKETPNEMLRRLKPELFDESGKTYNGGIFRSTSNSYLLTNDEIELFPNMEEVFSFVTEFEESFFLPLCSFDLKIINKEWFGKAHFIHFYKSQNDEINADSLVNEYGDYNVTLFKLAGNKISFIGDKKAFQLTSDELKYWLIKKDNFLKNRQLFQLKSNEFYKQKQIDVCNLIRQIGSIPMWVQSDETPIPINNEEIFFIGQLDAKTFTDEGGWTFLFYCPENQIFIQVEQWT
jgi:hypothetical protein